MELTFKIKCFLTEPKAEVYFSDGFLWSQIQLMYDGRESAPHCHLRKHMQKDKNKQTSILQQMHYKYTQHNQIHKCATNSEKENRSVFRGHYSAEQDVDICCYSL